MGVNPQALPKEFVPVALNITGLHEHRMAVFSTCGPQGSNPIGLAWDFVRFMLSCFLQLIKKHLWWPSSLCFNKSSESQWLRESTVLEAALCLSCCVGGAVSPSLLVVIGCDKTPDATVMPFSGLRCSVCSGVMPFPSSQAVAAVAPTPAAVPLLALNHFPTVPTGSQSTPVSYSSLCKHHRVIPSFSKNIITNNLWVHSEVI